MTTDAPLTVAVLLDVLSRARTVIEHGEGADEHADLLRELRDSEARLSHLADSADVPSNAPLLCGTPVCGDCGENFDPEDSDAGDFTQYCSDTCERRGTLYLGLREGGQP